MSRAATPDSKDPISFDDPMKMLLTDATRPRISSGVRSWMVVARMMTLMLSNSPLRKSRTSDKAKLLDRAKRMMRSPEPRDGQQQDAAGLVHRGAIGQKERHQDRAGHRSRPEKAQPLRPDVEDLRGEHRAASRPPLRTAPRTCRATWRPAGSGAGRRSAVRSGSLRPSGSDPRAAGRGRPAGMAVRRRSQARTRDRIVP